MVCVGAMARGIGCMIRRFKDAVSQVYQSLKWLIIILKNISKGFSDGSVVKNLPATAGDTGLIPSPGRSHMLPSNQASVPQLLSLCSRAWEPNC